MVLFGAVVVAVAAFSLVGPATPVKAQSTNANCQSQGGGKVDSVTGAPVIIPNTTLPSGFNSANDTLATRNPYYVGINGPNVCTVLGFSKWFNTNSSSSWSATQQGGVEALRLVSAYEPAATLEMDKDQFGTSAYIALPSGERLSAGAILNDYYNGGTGVGVQSDPRLVEAVFNVLVQDEFLPLDVTKGYLDIGFIDQPLGTITLSNSTNYQPLTCQQIYNALPAATKALPASWGTTLANLGYAYTATSAADYCGGANASAGYATFIKAAAAKVCPNSGLNAFCALQGYATVNPNISGTNQSLASTCPTGYTALQQTGAYATTRAFMQGLADQLKAGQLKDPTEAAQLKIYLWDVIFAAKQAGATLTTDQTNWLNQWSKSTTPAILASYAQNPLPASELPADINAFIAEVNIPALDAVIAACVPGSYVISTPITPVVPPVTPPVNPPVITPPGIGGGTEPTDDTAAMLASVSATLNALLLQLQTLISSGNATNTVALAGFQSVIAGIQSSLQGLGSISSLSVAWCHTFNTNLGIGSSGADVTALQTALTKDGEMTTVNGTYDESTASAVSAFQEKYASDVLAPSNLSAGTGYVGSATRAKLNSLYTCTAGQ